MTPSLGPTARNLVAAARSGLDPSAEVAARVRARIAAAVGGAASSGAASTPVKAVAPKLAIGKLAALFAAGALAVGGFAAMTRTPADVPAITLPAPSLEVASHARGHFASSTHDTIVIAPAAPPPQRVAPRPSVVVAPAPVAAMPTLAREVALIDSTIASLRADDPSAALATLAIYNRETQDRGQLAEDAAALEIDARCRAHEAVDEQVATFASRWPTSAQRAHLTKSCARL